MLNTIKGNKSSCKANFTRCRFANRGSRVQVFPSFRDENVNILEKHLISFPFVFLKKNLSVTSSLGRRFNSIAKNQIER